MTDRKISNIKERVLYIAEYYGVSKERFFEELGLSYANFRGIQKKSALSSDAIDKILSKYINVSTEWLVMGRGSIVKMENFPTTTHEPGEVYQMKTDRVIKEQSIPLYDLEATAGVVELFINKSSNKPIDFISIPNLPKCDGAVYITGDSMYPLLKSGDIVMYKELENSIDNIFFGEMYLLSIDLAGEEYVTVKWVSKSDKGEEFIKIVSQNSHHQPKDVHLSKVKAMALIKGSIRINSMS